MGKTGPVGRRAWPTTHVTLLQGVANKRDRQAWDRFVRIYAPLIHLYSRRRGLQDADALDVVQEVLLQVCKGIGSFRYDVRRGRFRNWLGAVTHRAMLKHQAKLRRFEVAGDNAAMAGRFAGSAVWGDVDEAWEEAFNSHIYQEAVKRLQLRFDGETWRAFQATFWEDASPREVAAELGRTVGWVYQAKSQVLRQLKSEILFLAEDSVLPT